MKLRPLAVVAAALVVATQMVACNATGDIRPAGSNDDAPPSLQGHEVAVLSTVVQNNNQEVSIGRAITGGRYSIAVQCNGQDQATHIPWAGGTENNRGQLEIHCSPKSPVTYAEIELPDYAEAVSFQLQLLRASEVTISIAPVEA
ncbi:hypothetical protein [Glutamicibacter arilaitensis]|uniref:hypothetical protein n=1 Tax=Glutamicibacter arilaitensis TaxID=256701 RepID=UPI00384AF59C